MRLLLVLHAQCDGHHDGGSVSGTLRNHDDDGEHGGDRNDCDGNVMGGSHLFGNCTSDMAVDEAGDGTIVDNGGATDKSAHHMNVGFLATEIMSMMQTSCHIRLLPELPKTQHEPIHQHQQRRQQQHRQQQQQQEASNISLLEPLHNDTTTWNPGSREPRLVMHSQHRERIAMSCDEATVISINDPSGIWTKQRNVLMQLTGCQSSISSDALPQDVLGLGMDADDLDDDSKARDEGTTSDHHSFFTEPTEATYIVPVKASKIAEATLHFDMSSVHDELTDRIVQRRKAVRVDRQHEKQNDVGFDQRRSYSELQDTNNEGQSTGNKRDQKQEQGQDAGQEEGCTIMQDEVKRIDELFLRHIVHSGRNMCGVNERQSPAECTALTSGMNPMRRVETKAYRPTRVAANHCGKTNGTVCPLGSSSPFPSAPAFRMQRRDPLRHQHQYWPQTATITIMNQTMTTTCPHFDSLSFRAGAAPTSTALLASNLSQAAFRSYPAEQAVVFTSALALDEDPTPSTSTHDTDSSSRNLAGESKTTLHSQREVVPDEETEEKSMGPQLESTRHLFAENPRKMTCAHAEPVAWPPKTRAPPIMPAGSAEEQSRAHFDGAEWNQLQQNIRQKLVLVDQALHVLAFVGVVLAIAIAWASLKLRRVNKQACARGERPVDKAGRRACGSDCTNDSGTGTRDSAGTVGYTPPPAVVAATPGTSYNDRDDSYGPTDLHHQQHRKRQATALAMLESMHRNESYIKTPKSSRFTRIPANASPISSFPMGSPHGFFPGIQSVPGKPIPPPLIPLAPSLHTPTKAGAHRSPFVDNLRLAAAQHIHNTQHPKRHGREQARVDVDTMPHVAGGSTQDTRRGSAEHRTPHVMNPAANSTGQRSSDDQVIAGANAFTDRDDLSPCSRLEAEWCSTKASRRQQRKPDANRSMLRPDAAAATAAAVQHQPRVDETISNGVAGYTRDPTIQSPFYPIKLESTMEGNVTTCKDGTASPLREATHDRRHNAVQQPVAQARGHDDATQTTESNENDSPQVLDSIGGSQPITVEGEIPDLCSTPATTETDSCVEDFW